MTKEEKRNDRKGWRRGNEKGRQGMGRESGSLETPTERGDTEIGNAGNTGHEERKMGEWLTEIMAKTKEGTVQIGIRQKTKSE